MHIDKGSRLVMIGDSITDCGRARPVGEGMGEALGNGYVSLVAAALGAAAPDRRIRVTNMGCSGNTVRDLAGRWETDVLELKPDWLSVCIGINDVWRQFDSPLRPESHVPIDEYEATLDDLLGRTRTGLEGLVLMTPYFIEPCGTDTMRALMDSYGEVVKKLAARHNALLVNTQDAFDEALHHVHPAALAWDRIHPNLTGHMILARAFLQAVDFSW
jgi:lysophospholipase L1-like esterase